MTSHFKISDDTARSFVRKIVESGFQIDLVLASSEVYTLHLRIDSQSQTSPKLQLFLRDFNTSQSYQQESDPKPLATIASNLCISLDEIFVTHASEEVSRDVIAAMFDIAEKLLKKLTIPLQFHNVFEPPMIPLGDPNPNTVEEADMFAAVAYLREKLSEMKSEKQSLPLGKRRGRLLKHFARKNHAFCRMIRNHPFAQVDSVLVLLEGLAILQFTPDEDQDKNYLDDIAKEKKWSKLYCAVKGDAAASHNIFYHIEMDGLQLRCLVARVTSSPTDNFKIERCVVVPIPRMNSPSKLTVTGRSVESCPGELTKRIQWLFAHIQREPGSFKEMTELLYYVGKIHQSSVPLSCKEIFESFKKYSTSLLQSDDVFMALRFNNMLKIQKNFPTFWGIVPFLNY